MVWEVVQNVGGRADKYTADIKFLGDQKFSEKINTGCYSLLYAMHCSPFTAT